MDSYNSILHREAEMQLKSRSSHFFHLFFQRRFSREAYNTGKTNTELLVPEKEGCFGNVFHTDCKLQI